MAQINMDGNNLEILIQILKDSEHLYKALSKLSLASEVERDHYLNQAAVAQMAYLQLEGISTVPSGIDWDENKEFGTR